MLFAEQDNKIKSEKIRKLEIEQKKLNYKIAHNENNREKLIGSLKAGKIVDPIEHLKQETLNDIEVCQIKLNYGNKEL